MYGQQNQLPIPPATKYFLDALDTGDVQLQTPDGADTVFAQKMQQGIAQGMPQMQGMQGAKQDYAAAAPSVARNAQEAQMRQALQLAMRPKPTGIEGLQSNVRLAEGGVIGYAGPDGSEVAVDESQLSVSERLKRDLRRLYERIETGYMKRAGATPEQIAQKLGQEAPAAAPEAAPQVDTPAAAPQAPVQMTPQQRERFSLPAVTQAPAPRPPAQRPPAPAQAAPQAGIAQLVAPTPEGAMASARSVLGLPGTEGLRTKEDAYLAALKAQPATGQQGLAALQAQQADLQRMHDKAEKESNINSAIQWLLGGREGPGGSARASIAFSEKEDARRRTYNDLQVANATKRDAIIDLQNAREVGNAKAALEAEQRIRAADMAVAKAEGELAASFASSSANVYGTQVRSQDEAANRANALKVEGIRAATREGAGDIAQKRLALQQLKADPEYTAAMNKIKELSKAAGLSSSPTIQAAFRAAQQEAAAIAKRYGLTPQDIGTTGGDTAAPAGNDPLGIRK